MVARTEVKTITESGDTIRDMSKLDDVSKLTDQERRDRVNYILSDPESMEQVKIFPDLWKSLPLNVRQEIAAALTTEVKNCIDELSDFWVEYSPEITDKDQEQIAQLEFVIENRDKIPQSYVKLEEKTNEVVKSMGIEIEEKWILDNAKADRSGDIYTDDYKIAA